MFRLTKVLNISGFIKNLSPAQALKERFLT
jgi:hypothetical protein